MSFLFSFPGRMSRLPYALASLAVFGSQHVFVFAALRGRLSPWDWEFLLIPLRTFAERAHSAADLAPGVLALQLLTMWMLAAFAFRRAADAGYGEWMAAFAIAPLAQLPIILTLTVAPPGGRTPGPRSAATAATASRVNWPLAVQGTLAGMMFIVAAVALSTLVFGAYGYGVFLVTPYVMGFATAMIANRQADIGRRATTRLVFGALALGGAALVLTALEGAACIVMAAPLAAGMAYLGGISGRLVAIRSQRPLRRTMQSVSVLPLVLLGETVLAPVVSFETHNVIEIGASPSAVWDSLVHMEKLQEPAAAFRLGFAYPLKGRIVGEGVGALRLGTFSTGTAIERITAWEPGRRLAFMVERDVPAMTELSPYTHVHAPHVIGYFTTGETSFDLLPANGGGTRLIERSAHTLRLDPALYWLPLDRWAVARNNARVLESIKRSAEAAASKHAP